MREDEFHTYVESAVPRYAQEIVRGLNVHPDEAKAAVPVLESEAFGFLSPRGVPLN